MDRHAKSRFVREQTASLGFERCGIARAAPIGRSAYLADWLKSGRAGSMDYLHRHFKMRADPSTILEGAKSVVVVAFSYRQHAAPQTESEVTARGRVAMYAWGDD